MKVYYITFRSVTYAQRGEQVLNRAGIRCMIHRTPKWMEEQGCGYSLRLRTDSANVALKALKQAGVTWRKVYLQGRNGQLEEWMK